jgi:hypothetical protein
MSKIAKADNAAMNTLYATEVSRLSKGKIAAEKDLDAFKDHAEMVSTLESVLSEDKNIKGSQNANDPLFD